MKLKLLSLTCVIALSQFAFSSYATNSTGFIANSTGFFSKKPTAVTFLPADDAFAFSHIQQENRLNVFWQIADGYYLYKDKVRITIGDKQYLALDIPEGTDYQDAYFGDVKIIKQQLVLSIPMTRDTTAKNIKIHYQGCAVAGLCYPPMTQSITQTK